MPDKKQDESLEIKVRIPVGDPPVLVNVTNVHLTSSHTLIFDFGYVDPAIIPQAIEQKIAVLDAVLVNRVAMGEMEAQQFIDNLQKILDILRSRKEATKL